MATDKKVKLMTAHNSRHVVLERADDERPFCESQCQSEVVTQCKLQCATSVLYTTFVADPKHQRLTF